MAKEKTPTMLGLRTCNADGSSSNGFKWPVEVGGIAEAPDWSDRAECGHGLHFLLWGEGDSSLLDWSDKAVALVIEPLGPVVDIDGKKSKTSKARVVYVGKIADAAQYIADHGGQGKALPCVPASTSGDLAPASTSGREAPASTSGKKSMAIVAGTGPARAGDGGCLAMAWWDAKADRPRMAVGYIGETKDKSGALLEAGAWYAVDNKGKFEREVS